jgi:hypothetical protein
MWRALQNDSRNHTKLSSTNHIRVISWIVFSGISKNYLAGRPGPGMRVLDEPASVVFLKFAELIIGALARPLGRALAF